MSYEAIVCRLTNVKKVPNADRLNTASAQGYQVIVDIAKKDGDLGILFREGGQLSHEMCFENNLYSNKEANKDKEKRGFFATNRRIRAQKFRGEISEGFWAELNILSWAGDVSSLKEGDQFDTFEGNKICQKYYTPATIKEMSKGKNKNKKKQVEKYDYSMLIEHYDTKQVRGNIQKIPVGAILWLSVKCHGTSQRTGRIKIKRRLGGFKRWWNNHFDFLQFKTEQWDVVSGTRRTVIRPNSPYYEGGFYHGTNFREKIHEELKTVGLHKGETIYYEVVGFTDNSVPIMAVHNIEDKELKKIYGDQMVYRYGCRDGECKMLVYRITQVSDDGDQVELSWPQVAARCKHLGLQTVVPLEGPIVYDGDQEKLLKKLKVLSSGPDPLDSSHIREGVVVRVEHEDMWMALKYKGFWFTSLEGIRANDDGFIDVEDVE